VDLVKKEKLTKNPKQDQWK